jgi:tetratricopeptide (TPR) repeat protein
MNRIIIISLSILCIFSACKNSRIAHPSDYTVFLSDDTRIEKSLQKVNEEIDFWQQKLLADTGSYVNMLELASNHIKRFKVSGQVNDLHVADSFYARCISKIKNTQPEIYFSISQNAITQHRFQDAWRYLKLADSIGVNPYVIKFLKFDAAMEIGLYQDAAYNLDQVKNENEFDYLIRKAKWEDHNGHLDKAILSMEKALVLAEDSKKNSMILWAKSNLADMYGHAGKIKEAYKNYLDVLKIDSSYFYALKGIAWVAFSHDKNSKEATRILQYILSQTNMPDLYLTLAEIAEWDGDTTLKKEHISKFLSIVENPAYGNMYNKYLINIYAEDLLDFDKAMAIAEKEVASRPTAETYEWLAWVYYKKGDLNKARELIKSFVLEKTFEPHALLHAAFILQDSEEKEIAGKLFKECEGSSYELGPVISKEVKKNL